MKALLIGGTGVISSSVTRLLIEKGWDVTLLNRGNKENAFPQAKQIICDINDEKDAAEKLQGLTFDAAAEFIAYTPDQIERDIRLLSGKVKQYLCIATAAAYQRPPSYHIFTESTPLSNPFWQYAKDKIACEEVLMKAYRETGFPVTIVRPSHTFSERSLPVPIHGKFGAYQVLKRMQAGKKVLVPNGGATLWTATSSSDFAKGFVGLMGNVHAIGENVHITSDESLTWNQIMTVIADAVGVPYRPCYISGQLLAKATRYDYTGPILGDKGNTVLFDNSKIKRLVPDFRCTRRFDEAAPVSVHNMLTLPELQKSDPEFDLFCDQVVEIVEDAERKIALL